MKIGSLSLKNLAILVSDHLRKNRIETVLTGGACVSIYTDNEYLSYDLDFVLISSNKQKEAKKSLQELGFYPENRYFKHPETEFFIDFVAPPLSVGKEPVKDISTLRKGNRCLKLLSPTDCVKDRLVAFFHWNDKQAFKQAHLVCKNKEVDLEEVRRWSKNEDMETKFQIFFNKLLE